MTKEAAKAEFDHESQLFWDAYRGFCWASEDEQIVNQSGIPFEIARQAFLAGWKARDKQESK